MAETNILRHQPSNVNFLSTTQYKFVFTRLPHVTFYTQTLPLPGVNLGAFPRESPFATIYHAGDKMQFDPLTVSFLVDEDLRNWLEVFDWMQGLAFPQNFDQYRELKTKEDIYSDATITTLSNKNNPIIRFKYVRCFPISLSAINFSSSDDGGITVLADMTLQYTYFDYERLP